MNSIHLCFGIAADVKRWLSDLRGKEMPDSFSWSYKRFEILYFVSISSVLLRSIYLGSDIVNEMELQAIQDGICLAGSDGRRSHHTDFR